MKISKTRSFSLIELMIVISIVAILSAIAVAQYQSYSIRAKIAQAMVVFDNISEMAKVYYDSHGSFPNLQQIGLYYDPGDPNQSPMANNLSEYIANYIPYSFLQDEGNAYTCPTAGYGGYISNLSAGDYVTVSQNGSLINVQGLIVNVHGTYRNYCQYYYMHYDPGTQTTSYVSGDFISTCENGEDDPNAANYFSNAGNQC